MGEDKDRKKEVNRRGKPGRACSSSELQGNPQEDNFEQEVPAL